MAIYITFGSGHKHTVDDVEYDSNCVASIECDNETEGREVAFKLFGPQFCTSYTESSFARFFEDSKLLLNRYFPRGIIKVRG